MKRSALKVGEFMQPVVVKGLIEQSQSVEKGLIYKDFLDLTKAIIFNLYRTSASKQYIC